MQSDFLRAKHEAGDSYHTYVSSGTDDQAANWQKIYQQAKLTDAQQKLVASFTRKINIICLSGIWCGDCVQQVPLIQKICEGNDLLDLRILDRDAHPDLQEKVRINAGNRVPVMVFCAEDYELVGWYGDRTLSRYRAVAHRQLGPSCPLPGAPVDPKELAATTQDWLNEIERAHLLLRLSGRLRKKHGD